MTYLDNPLAIEMFVTKFPATCIESFVRLKHDPMMAAKTQGEIMNKFMELERERMITMDRYLSITSVQPKTEEDDHKTCKGCGKRGNVANYCPSGGREKKMANGDTT